MDIRNHVLGERNKRAVQEGMNKAGSELFPWLLTFGNPIAMASLAGSKMIDSGINNATKGKNESWGSWASDKLGIENPLGRTLMEFTNPAFLPGTIGGAARVAPKMASLTRGVGNVARRGIKSTRQFVDDAVGAWKFNHEPINIKAGARQYYPWQRMAGEPYNPTSVVPYGEGVTGVNLLSEPLFPPEPKNVRLLEPPKMKMLDYGPIVYDKKGNLILNKNYYYRRGWGIIDDALNTGVIRVPEGDYKSTALKKYPWLDDGNPFSTTLLNHKFPYFSEGELWPHTKFGRIPEDLIAISKFENAEWVGGSKFGKLLRDTKPFEVGGRATPLINGETNKFPTQNARLFTFNHKTNRYEPYTELDWDNWLDESINNEENRRILQSHLGEYYDIEKNAKLNGTWLKMPDGSTWQGDPRSWVQLMSLNGKKLLPLHGYKTGVPSYYLEGFPEYQGDIYMADNPNVYNRFSDIGNSSVTPGRNYSVTIPQRTKIVDIDGKNAYWNEIFYNNKLNRIEDLVDFFKARGFGAIDLKNITEGSINGFDKTNDFVIFGNTPVKSIIGSNGDFNLSIGHKFKQYGGRL